MNPRKIEAVTLKLSGMTYKQVASVMGVTGQRAAQLVSPPTTVKDQIRRRRQCADCMVPIPMLGERGYGIVHGHVHHDKITDTPEQYNHISNLVLLCSSCHSLRHGFLAKARAMRHQ